MLTKNNDEKSQKISYLIFYYLINNNLIKYDKIIEFKILILFKNNGDWGLGIGVWGLGVGAHAPNPKPKPQNPNPKPQKKF